MKGCETVQVSNCIGCKTFPCVDVNKDAYIIPGVEVNLQAINAVIISEAAPPNPHDYYYANGEPAFQQTTVQAFNDAGFNVTSIKDILKMGVYLTSAVKCGKTGYGLKAASIKECSLILEEEISLFPNVKAFLLMGDVAIKAINYIALRIRGRESNTCGFNLQT